MNGSRNECEVREEQGFAVYVVSNQRVELAVAPELGAKIISLKNLRTGRQWMWHPSGALKLFRNRSGDDFSDSPLTGIDECLPTMAPCSWNGRALPDHGEVWSTPWSVDHAAWKRGVLKTAVRLEISPLEFERTIELDGDVIHLRYQLTNRAATEEHFLWAIHPLLELEPGDCLELPESTRSRLEGQRWMHSLDAAALEGKCSKLFAGPLTEGWAGVENSRTGDSLKFEWNPTENNTLGVWLTRGAWHGHHHFALEPTNGAPDALNVAVANGRCGVLAGSASVLWQVDVRIGPAWRDPKLL